MSSQRGYLIITALVMIVLFGLLTAFVTSMIVSNSVMTIHLSQTGDAGFYAETGLELGRFNLTIPQISSRQSCSGLSGSGPLGSGMVQVTLATDAANTINPRYAFSTLSSAISSGSNPSTISVSNSSVFAPFGRVLIGREVFEYKYIANGSTLGGVSRAENDTFAHTHSSGTLVSQYQCTMSGTGYLPTASPYAQRNYQQGIQQPAVFAAGTSGNLLRWNSDTSELAWETMSTGSFSYNDISIVNYHEGWAVANRQSGSRIRVGRLQGNSWTDYTINFSRARDLNGVYATSANEAWAVGDRGSGNSLFILRWVRDGSNSSTNWCQLPCSGKTVSTSGTSNQERHLFDVKAIDTTGSGYASQGFAVGGRNGTGGGNRGIILSYNGTQWSNFSMPSSSNRIGRLYGVELIENGTNAAVDAYFVGRSSQNNSEGKLFRRRNNSYSSVVTTTSRMLAVSAVDTNGDGYADFGVAVGENGVAYTFDGNFNVSGPFTIGSSDLTDVAVLATDNVWIIADNGTSYHFNGSTIETYATGFSGSSLNGIDAVDAKSNAAVGWLDVIN